MKPKLFVEAPLWTDTYFFSELNLTQREDPTESLQLGELYVDFENVSRLWHQDKLLNLRIGRMDIPFGEEYLVRDSIDNPLITHSLSDIWGVDEGVELYGAYGKFSYVAAVQNGGHPEFRDFNSDKSITARVVTRSAASDPHEFKRHAAPARWMPRATRVPSYGSATALILPFLRPAHPRSTQTLSKATSSIACRKDI